MDDTSREPVTGAAVPERTGAEEGRDGGWKPAGTADPAMRSGVGDGRATLVDHFRAVFLDRPEAAIYRFLVDGEGEPAIITNAELDARARAIAATLRQRVAAGERALIVCPPNLDYVVAFLACLYAGVIAIPVYPPNPALLKRTLPRLVGIIADGSPAVVLAPATFTAMAGQFAEHAPGLRDLAWLAIDEVDTTAAAEWRHPDITGADIAFLQYTSGSTGRPKGVMVSHANLLSNLGSIYHAMVGDHPDNHVVTWLPPYHDMGLIGGLLEPAYGGFPVTFMSSLAFLKRPGRWLSAISRYRATMSGAPNFAFDLCVAKVSEEERQDLDLSEWRMAFCGAEPVRAETIDRFTEAFAPYGFRRAALYPCYGLAEATLLVSGGDRGAAPVVRRLDAQALAGNRVADAPAGAAARTSVGCGRSVPGQEVVVADPTALTRLPAGQVGEVWVRGPGIAAGYWHRPEETEQVFGARLADTGEGPFLRTGDLGFLDGDELFVTGRVKDVIIIAGRNHYPQDIERSVEESHPGLRQGCGVACCYDAEDEERLVIVHETVGDPGKLDSASVVAAIRAAVSQAHGLEVDHIALVRHGTVPKTSSGKLQRAACRAAFLDGTLNAAVSWSLLESRTAAPPRPSAPAPLPGAVGLPSDTAGPAAAAAPGTAAPASGAPGTAAPGTAAGRAEIEQRLAEELAKRVRLAPERLDPTQPIASYGLRSVDMVGMVGDVERWLGRELPATLIWEYPTIEALAGYLAGDQDRAGAGTVDELSEDAVLAVLEANDRAERMAGYPANGAGDQVVPGRAIAGWIGAGRGHAAEPVAVIGIGCRLPGGADHPRAFWQLLCEGRDAVTEVPADRWNLADVLHDDPTVPGKTTTRWGGFLSGVDGFDPHFFGISPVEAAGMDPQQRLLAEVAWEALEDAGVAVDTLAGSPTGVFIGIATNDYGHLQFQDLTRIDAYTGTGNAFSIAANRLSYLFDLRGPSMSIDTACSSSLVAVYQAGQSLAQGECSLAIAGGVNLVLSPALAINFSKAGAMASDGRCKAFDARADGYVRAEGAGVVILKPLARALADQDTIYAVIRGGAVNQDGRTNGLMAPNPRAQEAVLRSAYARAGVPPALVHYVEAHGTGTLLGDPIEAKALATVLGAGRDPASPCLIGSVKSNLGHLEAAAGIAGLIKAVLMVRHRTVPPSLHYQRPNPHIPFDELPLRVADTLAPWPCAEGPALVGVSSFGFGGTNAHLVVQEAPREPGAHADPEAATRARQRPYLLAISARTEPARNELAGRYADWLGGPGGGLTAAGISVASTVRRVHHEYRLACVGTSPAEFREALTAFGGGEERAGLSWGTRRVGRHPKVAFLFSGQGPRWWPLATDLLDEPVFRDVIERCDSSLRGGVDWSLSEQLTAADARLDDPAVGQPALCAVQLALAALWRSWGVEPAAVAGHSLGEIAAAQVAGALSLDDAMRVALHRGRVIRGGVGRGRMAMAAVPYERARQLLAELDPGPVWLAASNGPSSTVFSGETPALQEVVRALDAEGIFCRLLESVDFASHCPLMDPLADELGQLLAGLEPGPAGLPMVSTVTGRVLGDSRPDAGYWAANLRRPVLFDAAVASLLDAGHDTFVEMSPHPMLADPVGERMSRQERDGVVVGSLRRDESGRASLLAELGRLYSAGYPVEWTRVNGGTGPMVGLPGYPWQRQRCWLEDGPARRRRPAHAGHPALETFVRSAAQPGAYHWCAQVDLESFGYLRDHRVAGTAVLPASFVLDAALAAARAATAGWQVAVEDLRLTRLTVVDEAAGEATLQLVLAPQTPGTGSLRVFSRGGAQPAQDGTATGGWVEVAQGRYAGAARGDQPRVSTGPAVPAGPAQPAVPAGPAVPGLPDARDRCSRPLDPAEHYAELGRAGLEYGPSFQGVEALWRGDREAVGRLRAAVDPATDRDPYLVHPALLDSCLQVLAAALRGDGGQPAPTYLPVGVGRFRVLREHAVPRWAHATVSGSDLGEPEIAGARVVLFDEAGELVGEVDAITLQRLDGAPADPVAASLLQVRWQEVVDDSAEARAKEGVNAGWWLLFADRGGVADAVRAELVARGASCVTVTAGRRYRRLGRNQFELDATRRGDVETLLKEVRDGTPAPCAGVLHAWSLDSALTEDGDQDALAGSQDLGCVPVLHLVQALASGGPAEAPRLVLVTRGAQAVGDEPFAPAVAQSALWGLARVVALEHGELRPTIIDLDPARPAADATGLLDELRRLAGEDQIALRGGRRYTPRLEPWSPPADAEIAWQQRPFEPRRDGNHRILATRPGILDSLAPTRWERTHPGPGQVEIEVSAAGLNFSDVLKALDICPGVPPGRTPLGAECAGRVVAVGEGVEGYRVGDGVMAVAPSSMAAFATTPVELVARRPAGLTDDEAAAVPIAFLTAVYGLEYLGHLGKGEKVLIHSATGGVGLAALQVARRNGAEVFATAGTEEKRELLRGLGVKHVMDSRSLRFADEIMELTDGRGVDVVLNSLAGEALTRSLALLAPNGRFVEIGKQDIYQNNHLGLGMLKHNRSFLAVDLERSFAEQPTLIARLFAEVLAGFEAGDFTALPVTRFGYGQAAEAFAYMAQARHTGKIVLRPAGDEVVAVRPDLRPVRPTASYLITGGLGALGLETARYLVDQGARHLALVGRGRPSAAARAAIEELRARQAEVRICAADISRYDQTAAVLREIDQTMPPLAGVVHAAGILDDGLLLQLDRDRFRSVAAPKVAGAWHLHRATVDRDLDFFVLYSSAAALLGSPSQGNYAAANAFLDALAAYRRGRGLSGLSINWGPWSEVGLAARPDRGGALSTHGIVSLRPADGIEALHRLLGTAPAQACVLPLDREKLRDAADSGLLPGLLRTLLADGDRSGPAGRARSTEVRQKMLAVEPGRRRRAILMQHCRGEAARVLKLDVSKVDPTAPLASLGFDSLMSLELRKRLEASLGVELPATIAWRFPTIEALTPFLAERMEIAIEAAVGEPDPPAAQPPVDEIEMDLEQLPEGDVEALLLAKMMQIDEGR